MSLIIDFYENILNLTTKIERKWLTENYSSDTFAHVVWDETHDVDLSLLGDVRNQLELLDYAPVRSVQVPSTFSDLYFQIYNDGRFLIEVLNWWGGQVNAHDHDFSGVQFQLKGDAFNIVHNFDSQVQKGALRFGTLSAHRAEYWRQGDRTKVFAGSAEPHSVFHLGRPTTSLLIRTVPTKRYGAQSNYFKNLAAHYYVNSTPQRKKLTALNLLSQGDEEGFRERLNHCFQTQSLSENLFMLIKLGTTFFEPRYAHLVGEYAKTSKDASEVVLAAMLNTAEDSLRDIAQTVQKSTIAERMAIYSLISSTNSKDLTQITNDVSFGDPRALLDSFRAKLEPKQARQFAVAFNVLSFRLGDNAANVDAILAAA